MRSIRTRVIIHAPVDLVWRLLTDLPGHNRWNPFLTHVRGTARLGDSVDFKIHLPGAWTTPTRVTILRADPERGLTWRGHFLNIPGLVDGEHTLRLTPAGPGTTVVDHDEDFRGILLPFFFGWFTTHFIGKGIGLMNAALKKEAERLALQ